MRSCFTASRGLFIAAMQAEQWRRAIDLPFLAHDLHAELDGKRSPLKLPV